MGIPDDRRNARPLSSDVEHLGWAMRQAQRDVERRKWQAELD